MNEVSDHDQSEPEQVRGDLLSKVTELERALAVEQAKNEGLERLAQAAQENAADLRRALRMLEVGSSEHVKDDHVNTVTEQGVSSPTEQVNTRGEQGGHRRWTRFSRWLSGG